VNSSARPLTVDEQVGGYKILGTAGVGGMGIVYKALDLKLERTVALKFLPHDLNIAAKDKERFLQEAKTASALDHTNIGVIHGIEQTSDGHTFIVMAYYEGLTLAEKIRRGPLSAKEAVEIVRQLARGLAEAHERNIIHRDIKPSNVIITRQHVAKIVDFGLARVTSSAATTLNAGPVGTLIYMSPNRSATNRWTGAPMCGRSASSSPKCSSDAIPSSATTCRPCYWPSSSNRHRLRTSIQHSPPSFAAPWPRIAPIATSIAGRCSPTSKSASLPPTQSPSNLRPAIPGFRRAI